MAPNQRFHGNVNLKLNVEARMSTKSIIGVWLGLSLLLNVPGFIALVGKLYEPLGILTLLALPLVVFGGGPGRLFRGAYPSSFGATEFGSYPDAMEGWVLLFVFWALAGLVLSVVYSAIRVRYGEKGKA